MFRYILYIIIILILFQTTSFAGLTILPARQEIYIPPGGTAEGEYKVTNEYNIPIDVKIEIKDWFVLPENKNISVSDWLSVSPQEVHLLPQETKSIKYRVEIPTSCVGMTSAMLSFVPQQEIEEHQGINLVISVSLFTIIRGTEKILWDISKINIEKNSNNIQITAIINNNGNVHLRPKGSVIIVSQKDKSNVTELEYREGRPIYPGKSRSIIAVADNINLQNGKYIAISKIKCYDQEKINEVMFEVKKSGKIKIK